MAAFSTSPHELDPAHLAQDVHRLFDELARRRPDRRHVVTGECMPVVDVFVTERSVEIVFDLPGVAPDALRILIKNNVVLVVGEKERPEPSKRAPASFHLVERDFGRFARAVRVQSAFDASKVRARLANGELHVMLPRVQERRGQGILIPVETPATDPGE